MPIPETKYKREQTVLYHTKNGNYNGEFLFIENTTTEYPAGITVYHGILFKLRNTGNSKIPKAPVFVRKAISVPEEQLKSLEESLE